MLEYNVKFITSDKDVYDEIKDIDNQISEETERYEKRIDQLETKRNKLKEFANNLELKYHIFDRIINPQGDNLENYFTERDIYFYKWVEAMKYIKEYSKLFEILSKKKYHAPEKFVIENIRPIDNYCVICLLKKPIFVDDKMVRACKLMMKNRLLLDVEFYNKDGFVTSVRYEGSTKVYHDFITSDPKIEESDKYAVSFEQTKMETDFIIDILESDHKANTISADEANLLKYKFQSIMDAVNDCRDTIKYIIESDK